MHLVIEKTELLQLPITIDPEIVSGTPVFTGTRVPVDALMNNLEAGLTIDEFIDNFPTVTRDQALRVLEFYKSKSPLSTKPRRQKNSRHHFAEQQSPGCCPAYVRR